MAIFVVLGLLAALYAVGALKDKECLMLPLITLQIVLCAFLGLFIIIWWIGTVLSLFDLVHYSSPTAYLTTKEFFLLAGVLLLILFFIAYQISRILYKGMRSVELNSYFKQHAGAIMTRSLSLSTGKPTEL
ncbi:unnamed protein product, partial [Mesorhabditis spiculigera]